MSECKLYEGAARTLSVSADTLMDVLRVARVEPHLRLRGGRAAAGAAASGSAGSEINSMLKSNEHHVC